MPPDTRTAAGTVSAELMVEDIMAVAEEVLNYSCRRPINIAFRSGFLHE